ncbi:hypothetical protein D3C81_2207880 [compost metagenome]
MIDHVRAAKRREFAEGMQLYFVAQRHHLSHQLLVGFAVIAQVVSHDGDFRPAARLII